MLLNKFNKGKFFVVLLLGSLEGANLVLFEPEFGLKIQPDNQVLIIKNDIFIFNQSKLKNYLTMIIKNKL